MTFMEQFIITHFFINHMISFIIGLFMNDYTPPCQIIDMQSTIRVSMNKLTIFICLEIKNQISVMMTVYIF